MKKILIIAGISLFVVLLCGSIILGFYLGPIVKSAIETFGPQIVKVPIHVEKVDISLITGSASVKGLRVGNPPGYTTADAITLSGAAINLDPVSLFSKKILIKSVRIDSPQINYEGSLTRSNLSTIMDNLNSTAPKKDQEKSPKPETMNTNDHPEPKIQIDDFLISGGKVKISLQAISKQGITLALPDMHLKDLGKENEGLTPVEMTRSILRQVLSSTIHVATGAITNSKKLLKNIGKTVGGEINSLIKGFTGPKDQ